MVREYITSNTDISDEQSQEVELQIADKDTREIIQTRAIVAKDADELDDPDRLTVVRGPHENIEEQWYIDILEAEESTKDTEEVEGEEKMEEIEDDVLRACFESALDDTDVINTRSMEAKVLLSYYVETGKYDSVAEACRKILLEYIADDSPELIEAYIDIKTEHNRSTLTDAFEVDDQ
ncbi:hypothetical protein ACYJ1Y_05115 [Natrialbaceae archaeon A-gly3]